MKKSGLVVGGVPIGGLAILVAALCSRVDLGNSDRKASGKPSHRTVSPLSTMDSTDQRIVGGDRSINVLSGTKDCRVKVIGRRDLDPVSRDIAHETRHYSRLSDEDFREEVFSVVDELRWAREGKEGDSMGEIFERLRALGDRAIPVLLEELSLAREDAARMAALSALQSFGTPKDPTMVVRALEGIQEGSPSRVMGAWLLLGAEETNADVSAYLSQTAVEAQSLMNRDGASDEARSIAVQVYGVVNGRAAENTLVDIALSHQAFPMRFSALMSLARNGVSPEAGRALAAIGDEKQPMLRLIAAKLAGSTNP